MIMIRTMNTNDKVQHQEAVCIAQQDGDVTVKDGESLYQTPLPYLSLIKYYALD